MDFNIGSVLKLVAEAKGVLVKIQNNSNEITENQSTNDENIDYLQSYGLKISKTKVKSGATCMIDGLGADEIFCGYRRYRASFLRGGLGSMINEMKFGKEN